ncbi:MAG: hypothetical protein ACQKBV_11785 [Puniceicoccales bacterium]
MPKKKKVQSQGNLAAAIVLGALTALIGAALGIVTLSLVKVEEVRGMPKEEEIEKHKVYYVFGKDRGGNYRAKEQAFLSGQKGMLRLTEEDLNGWVGNTFKFVKPPKGEEPAGLVVLKPSSPNFRINDGVLYIGMPVEVEAMGSEHKMRYIAEGQFVQAGDEFVFNPETVRLGSAKLPPVVADSIGQSLMELFKDNEDFPPYDKAWESLSQVRVEGDELVLIRQ